ncbi:MAG: polyprenyl synthetase family protein [Lactobacillus sp.]|jgi:geranylgeranyl diphosphate synthase type II|nr:polyprenyl synthetase family protein [Lactobacillus sp.]MCI2032241.1 polyprenyl synthetase family protein [Lactobacillus sp.]
MLEPQTQAFRPAVMATIEAYLQTITVPNLAAAMRYSLTAGGKRLRPLLLLAVVDSYGGDVNRAMPAAAGLECLHTYSLIHDDLPAMDNDDRRRGQPTSHKQFGEALAILAGDALQSAAFELLTQTVTTPARLAEGLRIFAQAVGAKGMVGGQVLDMQGEHQHLTLQELQHLHALKTGALIEAAVALGALLAPVTAADRQALQRFAAAFGIAFQIQDDINDVTKTSAELGKTANKDIGEHKNTYPGLLGLVQARAALAAQVGQAQAALAELSRPVPQLAAFLTYFDEENA